MPSPASCIALLRLLWHAAPLIALWALAGCTPFVGAPGLGAETPFYTAPPAVPGASSIAPGTLLRAEADAAAPAGAASWRILYRTTGLQDEPVLASGLVIVPLGPPPPGDRPVLAWAHPTTGVVPRCAPSLAFFRYQQIQGLREMLDQGFTVVATDYPGLGTAGPHPYLVGVSEARAVMDSVRAARGIPAAAAGRRYAVWGHSQGGHAALFTGLLARTYAPDLDLVGIAAAAPATDLAALLGDDIGTPAGKNLTAMTLWSWSRVFGASLDGVVVPSALPAMDRLAAECIESIYDLLARTRTERALEGTFLARPDLARAEPWRSLLAANSPGPLPPGVPLFLSQGIADEVVRPTVTRDYMERACAAGTAVRWRLLDGVGHGFIAHDTAREAVAWAADRFANRPAPDDCSRGAPVNPPIIPQETTVPP